MHTAPKKIYPVILSGGVGSRLWPLSRAQTPKQFLPLASAKTMIQETALRAGSGAFRAPIIVCNREHRFLVAEQMREVGVAPQAILLEPAGRNTAPAAAVAAMALNQIDPDGLMLLLPADHVVLKPDAFLHAVDIAVPAAAGGALATFGIAACTPETGYGYIQRGAPLEAAKGCFHVRRFVEKPDRKTAEGYLSAGGYDWNSGMFLFRPDVYLEELGRFEPEMLAACEAAFRDGKKETDFFRLDKKAFEACLAKSIDYAVMEHTRKAVVVPADIGWSDIGSWRSLWETGARDGDGNVAIGEVIAVDTTNSYLRSDGPLIAVAGVADLVVAATRDSVLVSDRSQAQRVKRIAEEFERRGTSHQPHHPQVRRPWGTYETLHLDGGYQVKRIVVQPGGRLSLQKHKMRAEHWIVVSGQGQVTRNGDVFELEQNQATFIPLGAWHRLANPGREPLVLIEVQCGSYLGEDDIERKEDDYGR